MVQVAQVERLTCKEETEKAKKTKARDSWILFILICLNFFSCQFGHGSNIGVAVSLPGNSKAMNLALGSWVMVGVCLGLPLTPWACRTFGEFNVVIVCTILDVIAMLLMTVPGITIHQIYAVRFLVGFFEAPFLPYLQKWLSKHGCNNWNFMNTTLHAMVPLGENVGFIVAQELVNAGYHWKCLGGTLANSSSLYCSIRVPVYRLLGGPSNCNAGGLLLAKPLFSVARP